MDIYLEVKQEKITNEEYKDSVKMNKCQVVMNGFNKYSPKETMPLNRLPVIDLVRSYNK